jgi:hypothetical protein
MEQETEDGGPSDWQSDGDFELAHRLQRTVSEFLIPLTI